MRSLPRPRAATGVVAPARRGCAWGCCGVAGGFVARPQWLRGGKAPMVIPPDCEAQILRYHHVEKWPIGTIARQLHVHHSVVRRVLAQAGLPGIGAAPRPSQIDAYLPLIRETLEKLPTLTASRLFSMVRDRPYPGRPDHFRHLI